MWGLPLNFKRFYNMILKFIFLIIFIIFGTFLMSFIFSTEITSHDKDFHKNFGNDDDDEIQK